jgi:hypothetical protein
MALQQTEAIYSDAIVDIVDAAAIKINILVGIDDREEKGSSMCCW